MFGFRVSFSRAVIAGTLLTSAFCTAAPAAPAVQHLRGTVVTASASNVTIATTSGGSVTVELAPSTVILGAVPASLSDIRPNAFIGLTNIPRPGDARVVGVFLLPESLRKDFAGSFPWDYPGTGAGSSRMTNGEVSLGSRMTNGNVSLASRMTNGTVSQASHAGPLRVTVSYNGSSIDAEIPSNTPVVRIVSASWKTLTPGAHLFAAAQPVNNRLTAAQITVGEQGVVPPM
jgi:hypothetical protein